MYVCNDQCLPVLLQACAAGLQQSWQNGFEPEAQLQFVSDAVMAFAHALKVELLFVPSVIMTCVWQLQPVETSNLPTVRPSSPRARSEHCSPLQLMSTQWLMFFFVMINIAKAVSLHFLTRDEQHCLSSVFIVCRNTSTPVCNNRACRIGALYLMERAAETVALVMYEFISCQYQQSHLHI